MIGLLAAGQGDKDHIFPASRLDLPGGDEPPGIAQQDDFQEDLGIVRSAPRLIIAVFLLETTIPWMALSMGFKYSVSLLPAIQATGFLALTLARLTLAEHASLSWTHNPAYGFPVPAFPANFT